jgi:hypothetical protein
MEVLWLVTALLVKHFVCDYVLQFQYMLDEKGKLFTQGGVHHAMFHALGTYLVFSWFTTPLDAYGLAMLDGVIHYFVDYLKAQATHVYMLTPAKKAYWVALGLDQLLHQLTYVGLIWLVLAS